MDTDREKESAGGELAPGPEGFSARTRNIPLLRRIPGALQMLKEACREFTPIRRSIYVDRRPKPLTEDEIYVCNCLRSSTATPDQLQDSSLSFDCKEKCINRKICTECEVRACPCGDLCNNRQFQLQQDRCVYPFRAGAKGWGLKAGEHIPAGCFVLQYLGEIFSIKSTAGQQRLTQFASKTCTYLMRISSKEVIDPSAKGNIARFINHSCEPNCITQKWHVLGEIAVGIFSTKDLHPGDELTFDYKFDVYRTPFMVCLCGAQNCKGFLGLLEPDHTKTDEVEQKSELLCEICKVNSASDDELVVCEGCGAGFHSGCLHLFTPSSDRWLCNDCTKELTVSAPAPTTTSLRGPRPLNAEGDAQETLRSRKRQLFNESCAAAISQFNADFDRSDLREAFCRPSFNEELNRPGEMITTKASLSAVELAVFRAHIIRFTSISDMRVFWNASDTSYRSPFTKSVELTVIGTQSHTSVAARLVRLVEVAVKKLKDSSGFLEASFRLPAIFLRRVLGEHCQALRALEKEFGVRISFNRSHLTEEVYPIYFISLMAIKGQAEGVRAAHETIKSQASQLIVRRRYMSRADVRLISSRIATVRRDIYPVEIRYSRDNALRDINHPFYTIYYKDKEVVLIGTAEEVSLADQKLNHMIESSRPRGDNIFSLNYLIPVCSKSQLVSIKSRVERKHPGSKMIVYDPLHPRKNVSLTLCASYRDFDAFFAEVRHQLDSQRLYHGLFDGYQRQMLYQMSKYFFKYLQNYKQTRSIVFMKAWDSITAEFDEHAPSRPSAYSLLVEKIVLDPEFQFYFIRVNRLHNTAGLTALGLTRRDYLAVIKATLSRKQDKDLSGLKSIFPLVPADYAAVLSSLAWGSAGSMRSASAPERGMAQHSDTSLELNAYENKRAKCSVGSELEDANILPTRDLAAGAEITSLHQRDSGSSPEVSIHYRENSAQRQPFKRIEKTPVMPERVQRRKKSWSSSSSSISESAEVNAPRHSRLRRKSRRSRHSNSGYQWPERSTGDSSKKHSLHFGSRH